MEISPNSDEIKKSKAPKSVYFILISTFLERYSTTGTNVILLLYLNTKLGFDQNLSTALFHVNQFLINFFSIFAAIIADSYIGLFKTLIIMSLIFAIGTGIITASGIEALNVSVITFTLIGIFIAVIGSGSVRATLTAFGGHQFKTPEQADLLKHFFSAHLLFLNLGSLLGRIGNPILREDVSCFGTNGCYPLAFGLPSIAMFIALIVLICGKSFYIHKAPTDNIFLKFCNCIICGLKEFFKRNKKIERKNHWLDYAIIKYNQKLINDTKQVLKILKIFLPIPIYWAVYAQQSSRWIFQATQMNLDLGWFVVKPDQMIALNPIFSLIFLPICNFIFYPLLSKIQIHSNLHKIAFGGFLCCAAFTIAIFIELEIEQNFISILWILPQFAVLALSEKFVFSSLLHFGFTEGPTSMKSIMTACVFVTIAFGNLIVTIVSALNLFSSLVYEFTFYVCLLFIAMIIFMFIIRNFEYSNEKSEEDDNEIYDDTNL
ncbi:hypothetical protein PVAND_012679 [Polypedilum vanderplanki]|uniref:Uncharacterized protein n=1 Tax=Polypedilum vanderplanki TaxID=319348 RepID=A0A9J6CM85_POLVA|nr:hypothetical protein PVAND_012679 [Polypedilum vanderplanki]